MLLIVSGLLAATQLVGTNRAAAGPSYLADAFITHDIRDFISTATPPAEAHALGFRNHRGAASVGIAQAKAGAGTVSTFAFTDSTGGAQFRFNGAASARANFFIDDLIFTSNGGVSEIATRLRFHVSGRLNLEKSTLGSTLSEERASFTVGIDLPGPRTDGNFSGRAVGVLGAKFSRSRVLETSRKGIFSDVFLNVTEVQDQNLRRNQRLLEIDDTIVTPEFRVLVGEPRTLAMRTTTIASERVWFGYGSSTADFQRTLAFPTDGPVFDLPAGVTVNSAQAGIVNNRFVTPAQTTPIPEPSSMALLGIGAVSLFGYGWRRKRSGAKA